MTAVLGFLFLGSGLLGGIPFAYATTTGLDQATCTGTSYPALGGSWDIPTSTCTLSAGTYTISSGDTLEIPSGATLSFSGSGRVTSPIGATLEVDSGGAITVEDPGAAPGLSVIDNEGSFTNSGTITIENSVMDSQGIANIGSFTNSGTITIENSGTDTEGITNVGSFTNSGTITIENSGSGSAGIVNFSAGIITNSGTITVDNSGTGSVGVANTGTITDLNCGVVVIIHTVSGGGGTYTGNPVEQSGSCNTTGVPEFPTVSALSPLLLVGLLLPALLIASRRFRRPLP
ncbi:MAG: hypothetical protein OK442_00375 [Thaumarchaeota archaeon]|nr:hypothetical protein [Nitrososphaerota archaeon]